MSKIWLQTVGATTPVGSRRYKPAASVDAPFKSICFPPLSGKYPTAFQPAGEQQKRITSCHHLLPFSSFVSLLLIIAAAAAALRCSSVRVRTLLWPRRLMQLARLCRSPALEALRNGALPLSPPPHRLNPYEYSTLLYSTLPIHRDARTRHNSSQMQTLSNHTRTMPLPHAACQRSAAAGDGRRRKKENANPHGIESVYECCTATLAPPLR